MDILDTTMPSPENTRFVNKYHNLIQQLGKETTFTELELKCILCVYHKFLLQTGKKAKHIGKRQVYSIFSAVFKIFDFEIIERILMTHANDRGDIGARGWVDFFGVIMTQNLEIKMKYAYNIYTSNVLNRTLVSLYVAKMFGASFLDDDEQNELITDMVETLFLKFDFDKDGIITFDEYATVVREQPMLLEFLGIVFPCTSGVSTIKFCLDIISQFKDLPCRQNTQAKSYIMNRLDLLMDEVQNTRFHNMYHDYIKNLNTTQFSEMEIMCLLMVYHKFSMANGRKRRTVTKKQLYQMFYLNFKIFDEDIIERILMCHGTERGDINSANWISLFSIILSNDLQMKKRFAFDVYSKHSSSALNREMVAGGVVKMFDISRMEEDEMNEMVQDMVETIFLKFDLDRDGLITYEEYSTVVDQQPMLLEFLGQVFPSVEGLSVTAYCLNLLTQIKNRVVNVKM